MTDKYILNEKGEPIPERDLLKWGAWLETAGEKRRVGRDTIAKSVVSTVFLGLNHRYGSGPPILWETLVMGGPMDREMDRCSGSREQALAMHAQMVERVKHHGKPKRKQRA